jgi:exoribonuclease II
VDRVVPMLPEQLSNLACSLRPNEDKFSFSAVFEMEETGKIIHNGLVKRSFTPINDLVTKKHKKLSMEKRMNLQKIFLFSIK